MSGSISARVLVEGVADGEVLLLDEPLSFWGGFNPANGEIIDVHHPQAGEGVKDKILVIPRSRGSAGTPACIAETLRNGSGPLAFILASVDTNICVGVNVANRLYHLSIPVVQVGKKELSKFDSVSRISIDAQGAIRFG